MATRDYWAFLIQREGDRSWLPLDSLETEILEGSYRIIARSQRRNVDVEIRLEHVSNRRPLPQHWSQKRMAKTNEQGFLLVLPFTAMQPGKWEVICSGDIMSDLRGDTWRHSVKLQVLPTTVDADHVPPQPHELKADRVSLEPKVRDDRETDRAIPERGSPAQADRNDESIDPVTPPQIDPAFADLTALLTSAPVPPIQTALDTPTTLEPFEDADDTIQAWDTTSESVSSMNETADAELIGEAALPPVPAMPTDNADDLRVFDALFSADDEPLWSNLSDDLSQRDTYIEPDDPSELGDGDSADVMTFTDADAQALEAAADNASSRDNLGFDWESRPSSDLPADFFWGIDIRTGATAAMDDVDVLPESLEPTTAEPSESTTTESVGIGSAEPTTDMPANVTASPSVVSALIDASDVLPAPAAIARPRLTIELVPSIYHFRRGEVLMIYGQVLSEQMPTVISQAALVVKLIDPQTASPIAVYRQNLQQQALPMAIAAPLGVPDTVSVQLLVGEVVIDDGTVDALAQQTFTATAAVDDLMAAIGSVETAPEPEQKPEPTRPAVDFGFFNLIGDAPVDAPVPAPRHKLKAMQDVELPGSSLPEPPPHGDGDTAVSAVSDSNAAFMPPVSDPSRSETQLQLDTVVDRLAEATVDHDAVDRLAEATVDHDAGIAPESPIASEFAMAESRADLPTPLLDDGLPVHDVATLEASDERSLTVLEGSPTNLDPAACEVVVDDLPEELPVLRSAAAPSSNPLLLPVDQPVPEPTLMILEEGDLVIGQAVHLQVKLPDIPPKLYVKLWISDRQTRTLLDGPRWMVDFVPNDHGELEATTQLTLPFGSLEVQIAAIAVEAATKRESYRAMLDQVVISPSLDEDMSALSFDEF